MYTLIKKIVTHAGTFHADELAAIALVDWLHPGVPIERTNQPTQEDLADPYTLVIDIGREYDPRKWNFDHHHDQDLPASNILVLTSHVRFRGPGRFPNELTIREAELLETLFFEYISDVDRGKIIETPISTAGQSPIPTINSIIRNLNNVENGFDQALTLMKIVVRSTIETIRQLIKSEEMWNEVEKHGSYAIQNSTDFIVGWQELAKTYFVNYLIRPNSRGGWEIISRDSSKYNIPPAETQTFRHNSGFMAVYATQQYAINHAKLLTNE